MAELYKPVPDLANRPTLPDHQIILLRAYNDLNSEGGIRFSEYVLWCGTYGIQKSSIQFEFIWDVLVSAQGKLASWKRKKAKASSSQP